MRHLETNTETWSRFGSVGTENLHTFWLKVLTSLDRSRQLPLGISWKSWQVLTHFGWKSWQVSTSLDRSQQVLTDRNKSWQASTSLDRSLQVLTGLNKSRQIATIISWYCLRVLNCEESLRSNILICWESPDNLSLGIGLGLGWNSDFRLPKHPSLVLNGAHVSLDCDICQNTHSPPCLVADN